MAIIRLILGKIILWLDRITSPTPLQRSADEQARVDRETVKLKLYHFEACPFCVKARRGIRRLGLNIESRDILKNKTYEQELLAGGGKYQVPCLRIEDNDGKITWMYESSDIGAYLNERFKGVS